jgi:ERCC4-related helicase
MTKKCILGQPSEKEIRVAKSLITQIMSFGKSPAIIFVRTRAASKFWCHLLNDISGTEDFISVTAEATKDQRAEWATQLNDGTLMGAVATSVWSTGIDIPNLRLIVLMDGIESSIPIIQEAGRGTRKKEGMEFEVLIVGEARKVKTIVDNLGKVGYNSNEIDYINGGQPQEEDPTKGILKWCFCEQLGSFILWFAIIYFFIEYFN